MAWVAEQSLITGGGEGRMRLAVFQRRVRSSARENFGNHRHARHWDTERGVLD